ncbi:MAG: efflux RND transporter periplasmic adaptor subunit [Planctomycetes bacterium]|nr:efflux RND transporter periplasmic adaptor subunit [Planctomycetota bacterium]
MTPANLKNDLASLRLDRSQGPPRRPWRWGLLFLLLLALGAGAMVVWKDPWGLSALEVETVRPQVTALTSGGAGAVPILTATGYVVPRQKAVVSAKIQGRLSELHVEEGSRVKEGDILARLESADYQAQVDRAKAAVQRAEAELEEARRQLKLAEQLKDGSIASLDQVEAAKSRVRVSEAALQQAKADLQVYEAFFENTFIRAPFSGVVLKKMAEVGESVAPIPPGVNLSTSSGAIVTLANFDTLEVEVDVSEGSIAKLKPHQPAEVAVDALPKRHFKAALRQIMPSADRTKATVQVKVAILERDENLRPEMSARATFLEETKKAENSAASSPTSLVSVPAEAVVSQNGVKSVFEVVQGKARLRPVEAGEMVHGRMMIKKGITGSEVLVLRPPESLRDGDRVKTAK